MKQVLKLLWVVCLFPVTLCAFNYGDDKTPTWNPTYTVKGILFIPYAEIEEPFYAWYDLPSKQSRIDYYGGMVKTYQLAEKGDYGVSLKIAPVTTESQLNADSCLQVNGTSETEIQPQAVLPSLAGFERTGSEIVNGFDTEKWRLVQQVGQKTNKYTMWLRYKYQPDKNKHSVKYAVPIRYEMRGYNSLMGSHYDHYFIEYDAYAIEDIDPHVFQIDESMTCNAFPGPGDRHIYTFNPMKEFIHPTVITHVDYEFDKFKNKHGRDYNGVVEHEVRKHNFMHNVRFINAFNRQHRGFTLGINHLADKTELEMKALRGKQYTTENNGASPFPYRSVNFASLPTEFDWRIFGAVSPVKDQSVCGSCWSFGTVGAIEGAFFLHNGHHLVRLSEQALVDCSWGYGNNGCDGGEDFRAYQWMLKHGGIPTDDEYGSYLGQDGFCHANNVTLVAKIKGYVNVTQNDKAALRLALIKHGPISVAIDAAHRTFSFYSNGVFYEPSCGNKLDDLDHAVLLVGYGTINGEDYWLIKNSWSNYWGNDGYILMSAKNNNCGVMTAATYVTM